MEEKITIVTAFFSLKRDNWTGFERTNNNYFDYFDFWARIQNDMVIYTDKESKKNIEEIRIKKYNRKNTKIIIVDDYRNIDIELYNSIKKAANSELNKKFHFNEKAPESWNYDYNYVMLLKQWCVKDAVEKGIIEGMIAWVDFGYNHGGKYYLKKEEFDFEWKWKFSNKIHLFKINELDNLPIFEIVRRMNSYFQGGVIVAPDKLWIKFWGLVKNNMLALNKVGLIDDDQTILLMSYRENKDIFELHESQWFSTIDDCSNKKFTIKEKSVIKEGKRKKIKRKINNTKGIAKYLIKWFNILKNAEIKE